MIIRGRAINMLRGYMMLDDWDALVLVDEL